MRWSGPGSCVPSASLSPAVPAPSCCVSRLERGLRMFSCAGVQAKLLDLRVKKSFLEVTAFLQ